MIGIASVKVPVPYFSIRPPVFAIAPMILVPKLPSMKSATAEMVIPPLICRLPDAAFHDWFWATFTGTTTCCWLLLLLLVIPPLRIVSVGLDRLVIVNGPAVLLKVKLLMS